LFVVSAGKSSPSMSMRSILAQAHVDVLGVARRVVGRAAVAGVDVEVVVRPNAIQPPLWLANVGCGIVITAVAVVALALVEVV